MSGSLSQKISFKRFNLILFLIDGNETSFSTQTTFTLLYKPLIVWVNATPTPVMREVWCWKVKIEAMLEKVESAQIRIISKEVLIDFETSTYNVNTLLGQKVNFVPEEEEKLEHHSKSIQQRKRGPCLNRSRSISKK